MTEVVTSASLVVTEDDPSITADHPIIGYDNIVTSGTIAADTADTSYPVTNLVNPATFLKWKANDTTAQELTITPVIATELDYVGIAAHNFGTEGISVSVGYYDDASPPAWHELVAERTPSDDGPLLYRFTAQSLTSLTVKLGSGGDVAEVGVLFAGRLLVLPKKLYQGLASPTDARVAKVTNGQSEAGQFLGRIVTQQFVQAKIPLSLIDPTYYRDHIRAFIVAAKTDPFFFAWRPQTYPTELSFCQMTNDPMPINESPHGLMAMEFDLSAII